MADSYLLRFLFEELDIRGAFVRLGTAWQGMQHERAYPAPVTRLLGEMTATAAIIGGNLKQPGRLSFQLSGHGPLKSMILDVNQDLQIRGMARFEPGIHDAPLPALFGDGKLVMTLDTPLARLPYQSYVPLEGSSIAEIFESFLVQSEQQPARLLLAANADAACGLFLQKLPNADVLDPDGWERIEQLAATVRANELALAPETLLTRLFAAENVRLYPPRAAVWHCPRDEEKVRGVLRAMGRGEVEAILAEADAIAVEDEICGHEYRFGPEILDELFPPDTRTLH